MACGHGSNDDLYSYDGYKMVTSDRLSNTEVQQPRQDSGVGLETMANAIHNEAVGTLFALQAHAHVPLQARPHISLRETVDAVTHTWLGTEPSVFTRYEALVERRRGDVNQTVNELRQWLEEFELPQAMQTNTHVGVTIDTETLESAPRKRSLSVKEADVITSTSPPLHYTANSISIDDSQSASHESNDYDSTEVFSMNEHLNLLLLDALPLLLGELTPEWDERQRAREDYDSINRARAVCLEAEQRSAQDRKKNIEISVKTWKEAEDSHKRIESDWSDYMTPDNWSEYVSPGGLRSWLEASVIKELVHGEELTNEMSANISYGGDSRMYIIPRNWDMTDRPRRTRLYSNTYYFLKYMMRERRVFYLVETRLEDLQEGRSGQTEQAIAEETKTLQNAMMDRANAEREYCDLMRDFLDWAVAHTTLEFQASIDGGHKPKRTNALTDDIPLPLVEDMIADGGEPELIKRYDRLRELERTCFPERFIVNPLPSKPVPTQTQPQYTPRGRQIPMRKPFDVDPDEAQFGERLARTLPRSFKLRGPLFRVKHYATPVPTLDMEMVGEPTSPLKPPETDYLRPPKPKRKLPLRMKHYPKVIEEYIPEPLPKLTPDMSPQKYVRDNYRTISVINERTLQRYNPPRGCLSLQRERRERLFREPLTPDNIDQIKECSWRHNIMDIYQRRASADHNIIKQYWQVMRQLSSRVPTHSTQPTHIRKAQGHKGTLRFSTSEPSETDASEDFRDMLDADRFERPEDQRFFNALEHQESALRFTDLDDFALSLRDNGIRVIDFALRANINKAQKSGSLQTEHWVEHIENIDERRAESSPQLTRTESVWWALGPARGCDKSQKISVAEINYYDIEADVLEGIRADEAGLFQRPISRLERHASEKIEVNVTGIESLGPDIDEFHDAPERIESKPIADGDTCVNTETEYPELVDARSEGIGSATEDDDISAH